MSVLLFCRVVVFMLFFCIFSCILFLYFFFVGYHLPSFMSFDLVVETFVAGICSSSMDPFQFWQYLSHNSHFTMVVAFTGCGTLSNLFAILLLPCAALIKTRVLDRILLEIHCNFSLSKIFQF
jgi:hypothetical protein